VHFNYLQGDNRMEIIDSEFNEKIRVHVNQKIKETHKKFNGQHNFLNQLFFSPGDEYYGFFDRTHTYKAIADLQSALEMEELRFILTDVEFDTSMNLIYLFDVEASNDLGICSVAYNTNNSTITLSEPKYLID
jgi:hypothetical protein